MVNFGAQGYFSWVVLNDKNKVVRHAPTRMKNLILNQGLDGIATRSWADSFVACAVGTGSSSPNVAQTSLDAEVKRTNVYLNLTDACSSDLVDGIFVLKRTFVFTQEGGTIVYNEAGFAWSISNPTAFFSRVRLPSVQVNSGERLIIQYELHVRLIPNEATELPNPISGIAFSGFYQYQLVGLKGINALGQTENYDSAEACNEPSESARGFLSTSSAALTTMGSCADRSGTTIEKIAALSVYVPGSYSRVKTFSLLQKEGKNPAWRSFGLGAESGNSFSKSGLVYLADGNFAKGSGPLNIGFTFSWNRFTVENYSALFYWQNEENLFLRKQNPLLSYFGLSDD